MKASFLSILLFSFSILYSQSKDTSFVVGHDTCRCKYSIYTEDEKKIFEKTEKAASFPGGKEAWEKYIANNADSKTENAQELLALSFVVDKNGDISDITGIKYSSKKKFEKAKQLLLNSGKWFPAIQNGHCVTAYCMVSMKL